MLNVFQSNRLEALVTVLSEQLKVPASSNVFVADTIMVQSPGMSQWLKLQLAETNGIVANINFPLPSSFIWRLYQHLLEGVPQQSPFNKDRMAWKIYDLLPKRMQQSEFDAVRQYLESSQSTTIVSQEKRKYLDEEQLTDNEQIRRYQLAQKIADVFDNYLMYRQHWLDHWQSGHNDLPKDGSNDEIHQQQWQAILWRDLVETTDKQYAENTEENPLHRAQMHQLLIEVLKIKNTDVIKAYLPPRLFVFGISAMPNHQLEVLDALSKHIDVEILWLNPCSQYWGDILSDKTLARLNSKQANIAEINIEQKQQYFIVGNPLLASWGRIGRDYLDSLTNSEFAIQDIFIESPSESLLTNIQSDILNLEFRGQPTPLSPEQIRSNLGKRVIDNQDDSLLIHNCHSRFRELEVLKDKLLGWFEQDKTLSPKDILVMVPNVEQYAPFIDAVFSPSKFISDEQENNSYIPYTIADKGGLLEEPLLNAFTQWLSLPSSRFSVSELVDYLELPILMQRFDINKQELEQIKFWLQECHIKWGKNAEHKRQWGLPEFNLNTWRYGIQRMILGFSLGQEDVWQEILAYQHIEGMNANVLAKMLDYFDFVCQNEHILKENKTLEQWHHVIEQMLNQWLTPSNKALNAAALSVQEQIASQKIRDANIKLLEYQKQQDFSGSVSYKIIQQFFIENLNEGGVVQRFLAGSMNFCTLMPMRSVPFKIICVLGLNEGDYPRQVDPISFDLVGLNSPRKGDRSRKLDDRYLFLEALISARQKLHLSYVGQSSKNNQPLMPSVILSELMDYCGQSYLTNDQAEQDERSSNENTSNDHSLLDHITIKHNLQPYDSKYYQSNSQQTLYKSYDSAWFNVAEHKQERANHQSSNNKSDAEFDHITIANPAVVDQVRSNSITTSMVDDQIDLSELINFWRHPIRYFYRNVLGVDLEFNHHEMNDNEVFEHDGLTQYKILSQMLEQQLQMPLESDSYSAKQVDSSKKLLLSGAFPNENWGNALLEKYQYQATDMVKTMFTLFEQSAEFTTSPTPTSLSTDIHSEQNSPNGLIKLTAHLKLNQYSKQFISVRLRNGKIRPEDKLESWLTHLTKCASYHGGFTGIIDKVGKVAWYDPIEPEKARALIAPWLKYFIQCKSRLFKWHIALALTQCESVTKNLDTYQTTQALNKHFVPLFNGRNLSNDEYVSKEMSSHQDLPTDFAELAIELCLPLVEAYQYDVVEKVTLNVDIAGGGE